jgi:hypothetical protein
MMSLPRNYVKVESNFGPGLEIRVLNTLRYLPYVYLGHLPFSVVPTSFCG